MNIEIGQIYYLCFPDGTGQYIKPTTKLISGWSFLSMFYISNMYRNFRGSNRAETYISINNLEKSIFIHNKDFSKYPNLCKDISIHLTKKQFLFYKRETVINSLIN